MTIKWRRFWVGVAIGAPIGFLCGCSAQGTLNANNVKPATDLVVDRHNAMLNGTLDPASVSDADKAKYIQTANLLKEVVDKAAQPDEVVQ